MYEFRLILVWNHIFTYEVSTSASAVRMIHHGITLPIYIEIYRVRKTQISRDTARDHKFGSTGGYQNRIHANAKEA